MITSTWPSCPALACIVCTAVGGGLLPQLGATRRWHDAAPHVIAYFAEMTERASEFRPALGLYVSARSVESPISPTRWTGGAGVEAKAVPQGVATPAAAARTSATTDAMNE